MKVSHTLGELGEWDTVRRGHTPVKFFYFSGIKTGRERGKNITLKLIKKRRERGEKMSRLLIFEK